jgi:uncharacterized membrane protein YfhO
MDHGRIEVEVAGGQAGDLVVRQTFDPGWRAEVDGEPVDVTPHLGAFLAVRLGAGPHRVRFLYDPVEVRVGCAASAASAAVALLLVCLGGPVPGRFPGLGLGRPEPARLESDS